MIGPAPLPGLRGRRPRAGSDSLRSVHLGAREPVPRWPWRRVAFACVFLLAIATLAGRLAVLEVADHTHLAALGAETRTRAVVLAADRGIIYDRHGSQLVANRPAWALQLIPAALPRDPDARARELATIAALAGIPQVDLVRTLEKAPDLYLPVTIKEGLDQPAAQVFEERQPQLPGVQLQSTPVRVYLDTADFAHVLGYTNRLNAEEYASLRSLGYLPDESAGKAGVEAGLEPLLRGRNGSAKQETNAAGLATRVLSQTDPVAGNGVYLSIDAGLQQAAAAAVRGGIAAAHVKAGAALVVDTNTGELLALASEPTYDSNLFTGGISSADYRRLLADPAKPLYDRALNGLYPPGSTFKMITAAAALQSGAITPSTTLGCPESIAYGGWVYHNWSGYDMGPMDVRRAIALSCDTFFYVTADRIGDMTLASFARSFGYGTAPAIEIPGAAGGLVPDEAWKKATCNAQDPAECRWNPGETLTMGIGQSALLTTPLIQAMYVAALANGGVLLQPTLVHQVRDPTGRLVSAATPHVVAQVPVSADNLEVVRQGMRACLEDPHGTGYQFRLAKWTGGGACKTGTAQYGGSGQDLPTHSWFTFFTPYDHPEIAIVVLIESGGEGDEVAEPVALKIAQYYQAHRAEIRG